MPPTKKSGGCPRAVDRICAEQSKRDNKVYVISKQGYSTNYFKYKSLKKAKTIDDFKNSLPLGVEIIVYHGGFKIFEKDLEKLKIPIVSMKHWVGSPFDSPNVFYVSKSHAEYHGGTEFIYNGISLKEFPFEKNKENYFLFLAKVKRSKKGVDIAIKVAKRTKNRLVIAGGYRIGSIETWLPYHPKIRSVGFVDGEKKLKLLSKAKALLVPIKWPEPFGLTMIEAMACGTPVIAFNIGAVPELIVHKKTGLICDSIEEILEAMQNISNLKPEDCRKHVQENFSIELTYEEHIKLYKRAISGEKW
jgi:glycosyltransferase involved in cell wall biosynthesis